MPPGRQAWDRAAGLERLEAGAWDLLVVGGGVVGAGIARDAALRGLAVALVDAGDWAAGTSSRTTKLAHGGLRYLEQLDLGLVRTALAERGRLLAIAPHLTRPVPFLLPFRAGERRPAWALAAGLALYDALAGGARLGHHRRLDAAGAREREPLLRPAGLAGAGLYWDARVRDARLVIETLADAGRAGAVLVSYCPLTGLERWSGGWVAALEDRRGGRRLTARARMVINAAGPWIDRVRALAAPGAPPLLDPTKGVHVVLPRERLPVRDATALFAGDGRLVFAIPEGGWTFVGTTDTRDGGDVDDLRVDDADRAYLLDAAERAFDVRLDAADIAGSWAGWRALVRTAPARDPSAIARDEAIEWTAPGMLTVAGGKLTTYRAMAEDAVDRAVAALGARVAPCATARRPLVPAPERSVAPPCGAAVESVSRARGLFGAQAGAVFARWREDPASAEPLGPDLAVSAAEVERAAAEMVETLDDLVERRLSPLPHGIRLEPDTLDRVARAAAPVLGWDDARVRAEVAARAGTV